MRDAKAEANTPRPSPSEDLRLFQERAGRLGITVTLPTVGPDDPLPELQEIEGEPLSATIIGIREEA